ncbi:PA domain-containing protein [Nocardioides szechwanensis]|uniref:PA domain-containing protein n=1 Tax=Nocardioides szechwanensis TaxID=1005944 RepID=A0A1H0FLE1_9ACTN|nr:S8 family serine peptidase [Nocardioides szechwanensis]SDN95466.1 PA domain-containing protein [Nocardioides szechwanensis]
MHTAVRRQGQRATRLAGVVALACAVLAAPGSAVGAGPDASPEGTPVSAALHLVTLRGPGLAASDRGPSLLGPTQLWAAQDRTLARVGAAEPVYRWTTALNGYAVLLTPDQAAELADDPAVALVERNSVRPLASGAAGTPGPGAAGQHRGGAGVVIGIVDSGISPEGPLFARTPDFGRRTPGFAGSCERGDDAPVCNDKLVAARWYVEGFGADDVSAASSLSARDDDGHGTQMASIAAGNAGVDVRVHDQRLGRFSGVAPQARLAVYKACWGAPDPADDGCATADLVTAVDAATRDGVDVLSLAVGGPPRIDTVELALLGAAEADIAVVAAAGNGGAASAHPSPWVTTVGGALGAQRRGAVVLPGAPDVPGAMVSERGVGPARMVLAARAKAPGATVRAARVCTPGSLDAAAVDGRVVVCDRGGVGRVDKSEAVALADGVGMVLTNVRPGSTDADFHRVPTVHVDRAGGVAVKRWLARHPAGRISLRPGGMTTHGRSVAAWSGAGSARLVKPDLVAPAVGVLGAVPPRSSDVRWDFVTGTSAATAFTSGAAAVLLGSRDWSAADARSALATTADRLRGTSVARAGAGLVQTEKALRPGLLHRLDPADYRAWWEGRLEELNISSVVVRRGVREVTRTVTNVGRRGFYFSSVARGFAHHQVVVTPAALRLAPGESGNYTVRVLGHSRRPDDGFVTWRGATGTVTTVPVIVR